MDYLLITSDESANYTLNIFLNKAEQSSLMIKSNNLGSHNLYFEESGEYKLEIEIEEIPGISYK
jgi:hypothetical protein